MDDTTLIRTIAGLLVFGVLLSIPVIAGILIGKDANARGMNGVGWGIGVFAVLIVFLPLYLIVRKPIVSQLPQGAPPPLPQLKSVAGYCNKCGSPLQVGSRFCSGCGATLEPEARQPVGGVENTQIEMKT